MFAIPFASILFDISHVPFYIYCIRSHVIWYAFAVMFYSTSNLFPHGISIQDVMEELGLPSRMFEMGFEPTGKKRINNYFNLRWIELINMALDDDHSAMLNA